jgi:TonB-linked SusC/RagA family outer membrane protein
MKRFLTTLYLLLVVVAMASAQRAVVGTVTGDDSDALIGATVRVKDANAGTVTDVNGKFSLTVPAGSTTLVFSYTGYATQEVVLSGSNVVDVQLKSNTALDEVVVTALGIKRDKKALGYASTSVSSAEIAEKPETDVARALIGRSPGVQIVNSSGLAGSGTKINVRGISTVTGDAQPLWIIDGVPVSTAANENNDFRDGNVTPTRNLDIDPNNIETINILRGLSATTLYGSQGRNGVILITTKSGSSNRAKRYSGSVSQSYFVTEAFVPEYQNKWGNGFDGDYGEFFSNWGYVFDGQAPSNPANGLWFRHPYFEHRALFAEDYPEFGNIDGSTEAKGYIPSAAPNNIKDFFQLGNSISTAANAGVTTDMGSFNVNINRTTEEGYIKNNNLDRTNISIGGTANLTKKLTLSSTFNYVKTNFRTPTIGAGTGSNSEGGPSVFANLFYVPRNIDLMNWPYQHPVTGASVYYRNGNDITNPRWILDNTRQGSNTDRFFSSSSVSYDVLSWLKATYRLGVDNYTEDQEYFVNRGARGFPAAVSVIGTGLYRTTRGVNTIYDHSFILSGQRNLSESFDLSANIGVNGREDTYRQDGTQSTNQIVFNLKNHRNFVDQEDVDFRNQDLNFFRRRTLLGAFADVTLGYKNYLYVNLQGRNDWASSHEKEYRSLLYPGLSLSFIPTEAFPGLESKVLNFLKLRGGYGTSANFADPYRTRPYLEIDARATIDAQGNVVTTSLPNLLANPELRPELQSELEGGLEARMFNNRVSIDLSVYNRLAEDQIVERPLDPSTGYISTFINAGSIRNRGIELQLGITPVRTRDFSWNVRANFTRNISKVVSLPEGSEEILIDGFTNLGNFAVVGQPFGVIKGTATVRDEQGNAIITNNGDYKITSEIEIIGDPNPEFLLSGFTDITWKGFTLGGQLDYVQGGQIFSYSASTLIGRGVAKELESFDPTLPVILPGVKEEDGTPNDIPMPASGVFFGNTIIGGGPDDRGIFDATRLRVREVYLNYSLPKKYLSKTKVEGITLALTGNNIWFRAFNTPKFSKVDPDRTAFGTGNGLGFDFLGGPSARRFGVSAKITF